MGIWNGALMASASRLRRKTVVRLAGGVLSALAVVAATVPVQASESTPSRWIVVLKDSAGDPSKVSAEHTSRRNARVNHVYRAALKGYSVTATADELAAVRADPRVAYVEADQPVRPADGRPSRNRSQPVAFGEEVNQQWNLFHIDAVDKAEGGGLTAHRAADVGVAVLDGGVNVNSPNLNAAVGTNCTDSPDPLDVDGHGTAVAGVVGARNNGGGVLGVAPGTKIWSVKVFGEGGDFLSALICGIDWVTANAHAKNIRVANMSLLTQASEAGHQAIRALAAAGVVTTASAGNGPFDFQGNAPAGFPEVLTVTAKDVYNLPWNFSAFALREEEIKHTISAPGVDIYVETLPNTLCGSSERCPLSGTSFSAPQVAAVVALCLTSGRCKGGTDEIIQTVRSDAREHYLDTDRTFGGTPSLGPKFYGHLVWAGLPKQR
ncbi:hypothetical protein CGZ69_01100 [Streptomyces peucetius subsp. caesius ATCC 27952]|nr:hypothetical protein CGZ69_01100 [Streptomyces peucetius subsp. caesius ATCC 27952]